LEKLPIPLVVEDDDLIQSSVEDVLTNGVFKTVIASSGKRAVEFLEPPR
jgi:CheY-like chemotaxis protein